MVNPLKQDPFALAQQILQVFPGDEPWGGEKTATLQEFIEETQKCRDGKTSWEYLRSERFRRFHYMGGFMDPENPNLFMREEKPPTELLDKLLAHPDMQGGHIKPGSPEDASRTYYTKTGYLRDTMHERMAPLAAMLARVAIVKVLTRQNHPCVGRHTDPDIKINGNEVVFTTRDRFDDIRRQAIAELPAVKAEIASMFFEQGEGENRHYRIVRPQNHPLYWQLPNALGILFTGTIDGKNFINEAEGKEIPKAIEVQHDDEWLARLAALEEADKISHYYAMRGAGRTQWVERVFNRRELDQGLTP